MSIRLIHLPLVALALTSLSVVAGCAQAQVDVDPSTLRPTPSATVEADADATVDPSGSPFTGLTILALGDSNVYAAPDDCGPCRSYPHLLSDRVAEATGMAVRVLDGSQHNGLNAFKLHDELTRDTWGPPIPGFPVRTDGLSPREAVSAADVITITVGANNIPWFHDSDPCSGAYGDACIELIEAPYIARMDAVLAEIAAIRGTRPTAIRVTTYYNDLVAGPGYDPTWFYDDARVAEGRATAVTFLERWSTDLCAVARTRGARCVDLFHLVNGPSGTEPLPAGWYSKRWGDLNQQGHEDFAAHIFAAGLDELATLVAP